MTKNNLYYLLVLSAHSLLWAADVPGTLDTSFNLIGTATVAVGPQSGAAGVAIQQDGTIVLAGTSRSDGLSSIALARLSPDGSLLGTTTASFTPGSDGPSEGYGIALQQDGKIVVAGMAPGQTFGVARFNSNGSLDTDFNTIGTATTRIGNENNPSYRSSVAIQTDGKIVVAGNVNDQDSGKQLFGVARFNADGSLDTNFGAGSGTTIPGTVVVTSLVDYEIISNVNVALQQPNGKIVLAAVESNEKGVLIARLTAGGLLDTSFGKEGIVILENLAMFPDGLAPGLAIQNDGKIVVCGSTLSEEGDVPSLTVARLNSDGTEDSTFNGTGRTSTTIDNESSVGFAVTIQPNGKIVASGAAVDMETDYGAFGVARFNPNGTLDTSFNPDGVQPGTATAKIGATDYAFGVALQADGKIVLGGADDFDSPGNMVVARFFGGGGDVPPSGNNLFTQRLIAKYSSRV